MSTLSVELVKEQELAVTKLAQLPKNERRRRRSAAPEECHTPPVTPGGALGTKASDPLDPLASKEPPLPLPTEEPDPQDATERWVQNDALAARGSEQDLQLQDVTEADLQDTGRTVEMSPEALPGMMRHHEEEDLEGLEETLPLIGAAGTAAESDAGADDPDRGQEGEPSPTEDVLVDVTDPDVGLHAMVVQRPSRGEYKQSLPTFLSGSFHSRLGTGRISTEVKPQSEIIPEEPPQEETSPVAKPEAPLEVQIKPASQKKRFDVRRVTSLKVKWHTPTLADADMAVEEAQLHHERYSVLGSSPLILNEFGTGITTYLILTKRLACLLLGLFLLSLPAIFLFASGAFIQPASWMAPAINLATLGDFGPIWQVDKVVSDPQYSITLLQPDAPWSSIGFGAKEELDLRSTWWLAGGEGYRSPLDMTILGSEKVNKPRALRFVAAVDLVAVFVLMAVSLVMRRSINRRDREADKKTYTISDYTAMVTGLPRDVAEEDVHRHFSQWGRVQHTELVHNDSWFFDRLRHVSRLVEEAEEEVTMGVRAQATRQLKEQAAVEMVHQWKDFIGRTGQELLQQVEHRQGGRRVVAAFVTYNLVDDMETATRLYAPFSNRLVRLALQPQELRMEGTACLKVARAPEPTDIQHINLEGTGPGQKMWRRAYSVLVMIFVLLLAFAVVCGITSFKARASGAFGLSEAQCAAILPASCRVTDLTQSPMLQATAGDLLFWTACEGVDPGGIGAAGTLCPGQSGNCKACACASLGSAPAAAINQESSGGWAGLCSRDASQQHTWNFSQALSLLAVLAVNSLVCHLSRGLATFEKHYTFSEQRWSYAKKLVLSLPISSIFLIMMANMAAPWAPGSPLFTGIYPDLTPQWYRDVGACLVILVFMYTLLALLRPLWLRCGIWWRRFRARSVKTQSKMNELVMGPEYDMHLVMCSQLNVLVITLLFGGPVPALYPSALAFFIVSYLATKYELLRVSRMPPLYSSRSLLLIPSAIWWLAIGHLIVSIWGFSFLHNGDNPQAPVVGPLAKAMVDVIAWALPATVSTHLTLDRALQDSIIYHTATLAVIAVVMLVRVAVKLVAWTVSLILLCTTWRPNIQLAPSFVRNLFQTSHFQPLQPSLKFATENQLLVGPQSYHMRNEVVYARTETRHVLHEVVAKAIGSSSNNSSLAADLCSWHAAAQEAQKAAERAAAQVGMESMFDVENQTDQVEMARSKQLARRTSETLRIPRAEAVWGREEDQGLGIQALFEVMFDAGSSPEAEAAAMPPVSRMATLTDRQVKN